MILTNTDLGNIQTDGVYIAPVAAAPVTPTGPPTGRVIVVGGGNDGTPGVLQLFTDQPSGMAIFGNDTASTNSLLQQAFLAMPECVSFGGIRVTDGTDTPAVILLNDTSAGTLVTLTRKCSGSYANQATAQFTLLNAAQTGSPAYSLAISYPGQPQEFYANIPAYAVAGGGYNAPAFAANVVSQVMGLTRNVAGSTRWNAVVGAGTHAPVTTVETASGGTDGTSGITSSTLIGTNPLVGKTGMYAATGNASGAQIILSGITDATVAQTMIAFAQQENAMIWMGFPKGTSTATAIASRQSNNLSNPSLFLGVDWVYWYDVIQGIQVLIPPIGKMAGVIASLPAYQYPGNFPIGGVQGVTATERISGINTVSNAEAAQRQQNGILYLGWMPRNKNGPSLGLPFGMSSDAVTIISDVRMAKSIADGLQAALGAVVGQMMNPLPGPQLGQPAFGTARDAADAYLNTLLNGPPQQIAGYNFILNASNNSPTTVKQGFLIPNVLVTTFSAAQFILTFLQVGKTVQVAIATPQGA